MKLVLGVHRNYWFLILSFFLVVSLHFLYPQFYLLYIYLAAIFLLATFLNYKNLFLFLIFYAIVAPTIGHQYPIIPIYFHLGLGLLIFLLVIVYFIIEKITVNRVKVISDKFNYVIVSFVAWGLVCFFIGIVRGYSLREAVLDLAAILYYLTYFVLLHSDEKFQNRVLKVIIFSIFVCGIEYILIAGAGYASQLGFVMRIITRQANLGLFFIPLFITRYFFERANKRKLILLLLTLPVFAMLLLSQQRSLWISVLISLIVAFYLCMKFLDKRRILTNSLLLIAFLVAGFAVTGTLSKSQFFTNFISLRFGSIFAPTYDLAFIERMVNVKLVLDKINLLSILPDGLGTAFFQPWMLAPLAFVDNSYINSLWKMGWLGLIFLLSIWIWSISRSLKLVKLSPKDRIFAISFAACFIAILIHSLTISMIVRYHYNLVWGALIGILNKKYLNVFSEKSCKKELL